MRQGRTETAIVAALVAILTIFAARVFVPERRWTVVLIYAVPLATYAFLEWLVRKGRL